MNRISYGDDTLNKDLIKNNPYMKYVNNRTDELVNSFISKFKDNDKTAWIKFVGAVCQSLAMNEADVMQNQAVLNDPSPYRNGLRDELLKQFGKQFIDNTLSKGNQTYKKFDKRRYMNDKGGADE